MGSRKKHYTEEFKVEAVRLLLTGKKSLDQVSSELGISVSILSKWRIAYEASNGAAVGKVALRGVLPAEEKDLADLKKELEQLRKENEILKKAAAFFAKSHI